MAGIAQRVGIGECTVAEGDAGLRANLGSCVGICLVRPRTGTFALAHVLLPRGPSESDASLRPFRFAESAVPAMLDALGVARRRGSELIAYVAGGASVYDGPAQRHQVGLENRAAVLEALREHGIEVAGVDLGGAACRQLVVDGASGTVTSLVLDDAFVGDVWPFPPTFRAASA